jgi:hypothetical protein
MSQKESNIVYLKKKKLEEMYNFSTKSELTVPGTRDENIKLFNIINKTIKVDGNKTQKKFKSLNTNNNLYTPKKIENNNLLKVNKRPDRTFTNIQRTKNNERIKNINFRTKNNNDLMNYSLSYKSLNNNSNYLTNSHSSINYNTQRNINFEKIRKNNFRKDTYCTSIEKKRRALGLQFNPNFDKELSMQTDKGSFSKKILEKFKTYKVKKKDNKSDYKTINSNDYSMDKHKLIKVNKRDEGNSVTLNMERINETPQRFKIIKSNVNKHKFVKNKTTTNFNYGRKGMNNDLKKSVNDLKNKNLKKGNNIFSKYILSDNNNSNSLSQINQVNDNSNISVGANKTINIV